jgi:ATP-binding cassette subfamily B protein
MKFPFYPQLDAMDCGPSCLRMVCKYYGKSYTLQLLRDYCQINRNGVSLLGISRAAEKLGFNTVAAKVDYDTLVNQMPLPCIVHWYSMHFIVVYKISGNNVYCADPAQNLIVHKKNDFLRGWVKPEIGRVSAGVVLSLEPGIAFHSGNEEKKKGLTLGHVLMLFLKHRKIVFQLILSLIIGSSLQLIIPFFSQAIVDVGIATKDIQFIYLLLLGQFMILCGSTLIEFSRSWIFLHLGARVNITMLSNYFVKLMRLPFSFFDIKKMGDILQRMSDHSRVQGFLTGTTLNIIFAFFNFVIFTAIIVSYDLRIFLVFLAGSSAYFGWILLFLRPRRALNYKSFEVASVSQSVTIQLIQGIQEIKLNNCEQIKRWEWERVQAKTFKLGIRGVTISQIQQAGAFFINQAKNIAITFISAQAVVEGRITLGGMLAIQYIIGQLNGPVMEFIHFSQSFQDAKISLERINELYTMEDEDNGGGKQLKNVPDRKDILIENLSFKYPGYADQWVLDNIDLYIPAGKVTAIVGTSGSGKTTLLKLLMKIYEPGSGCIRVGNTKIQDLDAVSWRSVCGIVMQDGFIFSDTIANNIGICDEIVDVDRMLHAAKVANIDEFIEELPEGYNTKIGSDGVGISHGQRQRLLVARAVYKDPDFLFLDEATSSLDANNERMILENLEKFYLNRTVVVVAHRLSTVKNAHQIIVLEKGRVTEIGDHHELVHREGAYYKLVKNQLVI